MLGDAALGAGVAFCLALITTPVGVSRAVFLVPFQISVVQTPSPAVTPTNLIYNLIAIPGALLRFHGERRLGGPLMRLLILGTLPGVVAGAVIRVFLLGSGEAFLVVVAAVLIPLGAWLALATPPTPAGAPDPRRHRQIVALSLAVGTVGGIYGIGGGSILGPILVGFGFSVFEVALAALAATFLTSVAGVLAYAVISLGADGDIAPEWALGVGMGSAAWPAPTSAPACSRACPRPCCGAASASWPWRSGHGTSSRRRDSVRVCRRRLQRLAPIPRVDRTQSGRSQGPPARRPGGEVEEMFYCERCGSRFNETVAAASSNCPRCREADGVEAPLRFRLFSRSALRVAGIEPKPAERQSAEPANNR